MQHAVRYVEEGLMSLTAMNQSDDPHDLDKDAPQNELEKEVWRGLSLSSRCPFAPLESTASLAPRSCPALLRPLPLLTMFIPFRSSTACWSP